MCKANVSAVRIRALSELPMYDFRPEIASFFLEGEKTVVLSPQSEESVKKLLQHPDFLWGAWGKRDNCGRSCERDEWRDYGDNDWELVEVLPNYCGPDCPYRLSMAICLEEIELLDTAGAVISKALIDHDMRIIWQ